MASLRAPETGLRSRTWSPPCTPPRATHRAVRTIIPPTPPAPPPPSPHRAVRRTPPPPRPAGTPPRRRSEAERIRQAHPASALDHGQEGRVRALVLVRAEVHLGPVEDVMVPLDRLHALDEAVEG